MKLLIGILYLLALIMVGTVSALAGKYFSWGGQTDEYEKYGFQIASVAGSWVSALATLAAVIAAMYAVWAQIRESRRLAAEERIASIFHSRGACFSHSMAVINQLRGRLKFIQRTIIEGGRPAFAIPANANKLSSLFDQLLDRENFHHLPGPIVDAIGDLAGSIFGVEMLAQGIFLPYAENQARMLPARPDLAGLSETFNETDKKLDDLFTMFENSRKEVDELIAKVNQAG